MFPPESFHAAEGHLSGTLPVDEVFPGSRSCTGQGGKSQGSQDGEETKEQKAFNAIIADTSEGVQVVLRKQGHAIAEGWVAKPRF